MKKGIWYLKFNWLSIFFIFMLFAIGGMVRSTGSGMGCPDWPKCFGEYVPPTSEANLPNDYQDYYKEQRITKTHRFALLLRNLGLEKLASQIENADELEEIHHFNVTKAYVEYFNRLWGALTGMIVFVCFLLSFTYLRKNKIVFVYTFLGFLAVFFNALLGAVVVNSNLLGGIVTAHFIAAFAAICFFILARKYAGPSIAIVVPTRVRNTTYTMLVLSTVQVILGAEVREIFDNIIDTTSFDVMIDTLGHSFQYHALLGALLLVTSIYQFIQVEKNTDLSRLVKWITIFTALQLVFGPLALFDSTASISKLFHISFGAGIFIVQFYICTTLIQRKS